MSNKPFFAVSVALVTLSASACSTSHTDPGDMNDVGIQLPDAAALPDVVTIDAPVVSQIGTACTSDPDCGSGNLCSDIFGPAGYCTAACDAAAGTGCPDGSTCVGVSQTEAYCLLACDPAVTTRQCGGRPGLGCSTAGMTAGLCVPGCVDASDCGGSLACDPTGGDFGAGACYTPGAANGAPCTDDSMCPAGGLCETEDGAGWPGGGCVVIENPPCDVASNTGCMGDAQCIASQGGFGGPPIGLCVDGCTTSADCRVGYSCEASGTYPDRHYCAPACTTTAQCTGTNVCNVGLGLCAPPFNNSQLGGTCQRFDPTTCSGGTCFSERSSGFPDSYCTYQGCSATQPCPTGGVCSTSYGATGICLDACTSDANCRAGYACRPSDPANASSPLGCVPACTSTAQCTRTGNVCNVGTGLCTAAFTAANLGMPCTSDATCTGGRCMTEAATGYPSGECVYPGCSLTGGTGATCPTGSACVDDALGDPALGICAPTCTVGATTCRDGYACVASAGSTTEGTCQPSCTPTSCAAGRTCDGTTHLCM